MEITLVHCVDWYVMLFRCSRYMWWTDLQAKTHTRLIFFCLKMIIKHLMYICTHLLTHTSTFIYSTIIHRRWEQRQMEFLRVKCFVIYCQNQPTNIFHVTLSRILSLTLITPPASYTFNNTHTRCSMLPGYNYFFGLITDRTRGDAAVRQQDAGIALTQKLKVLEMRERL